jgi:hypothetical protein
VKVWDADRRHWHYEPVTVKKADPIPSPSPPKVVVVPATPAPTPPNEQLDELIRQYRRAKGETP